MAAEVLQGNGYDFSSDIWSLGCILYELVVLKSPFKSEGLKLYALFQKISQGDYLPLPDTCSSSLRDLTKAMLATVPSERPDIGYICSIAKAMRTSTHEQYLRDKKSGTSLTKDNQEKQIISTISQSETDKNVDIAAVNKHNPIQQQTKVSDSVTKEFQDKVINLDHEKGKSNLTFSSKNLTTAGLSILAGSNNSYISSSNSNSLHNKVNNTDVVDDAEIEIHQDNNYSNNMKRESIRTSKVNSSKVIDSDAYENGLLNKPNNINNSFAKSSVGNFRDNIDSNQRTIYNNLSVKYDPDDLSGDKITANNYSLGPELTSAKINKVINIKSKVNISSDLDNQANEHNNIVLKEDFQKYNAISKSDSRKQDAMKLELREEVTIASNTIPAMELLHSKLIILGYRSAFILPFHFAIDLSLFGNIPGMSNNHMNSRNSKSLGMY